MRALFSVTLFVSAALLFLVQPMVGKVLAPALGGAPAVWNTCMVFFQATLLAGYLYAHATVRWLGVRRQALVHVVILLLPWIVLPLHVNLDDAASSGERPVAWLLARLLGAVGAPLFVLSASAPLVQRWFAETRAAHARDPFALYAASNLGSMAALVAYPSLVEPLVGLTMQARLWTIGYAVCSTLLVASALTLTRGPRAEHEPIAASEPTDAPIAVGERLRWLLLAFTPSSLMLGVTTYLSADVASVPLLWVVPLALYLGAYVLAFAERRAYRAFAINAGRAAPWLLVPTAFTVVADLTRPPGLLIALHLATLFATSLACHGELAARKPTPARLTEFYLWISIGGVLGGLFNSLVAPIVFSSAAEYPIALALAGALAAPALSHDAVRSARSLVGPLLLGVASVALVRIAGPLGAPPGSLLFVGLAYAAPLGAALIWRRQPRRFGLAMAAVLLPNLIAPTLDPRVRLIERSFFGVHRVLDEAGGAFHLLVDGRNVQGVQATAPDRRLEPLISYHRSGPIGDVFAALAVGPPRSRFAVVGLGAGALACYGTSGQQWTFYELNPVVEDLARNDRFFTYLRDCPPRPTVVLGDARLALRRAPAAAYDVMVLDAFSASSVPVHLVTREAIQEYFEKLAPNGLLVIHASNRFVRLAPVIGALARDLGLAARWRDDAERVGADWKTGWSPSQWVLLGHREADFGPLLNQANWTPPPTAPGGSWSDDFSNVLTALAWREIR